MKNLFLLISTIFLFVFCSKGDNDSKAPVKKPPVEFTFKGKNLVTFGNSITAADNSWAYRIFKSMQFAELYNGAVGGAIWSKRERTTTSGKIIRTQNFTDADYSGISNSNAANPSDEEYQKRINNCAIVHIQKYMSDKTLPVPDFAILSYGTNDLSSTDVMGDADAVMAETDLSKVNLFNMAGALRWSIETLRTKNPKLKLYVLLPLQASSPSKNDGNLRKIEVIKRVCNKMSVSYFDCYFESGITVENAGTYLRDGLHPNASGQVLHGNYVAQKLENVNK